MENTKSKSKKMNEIKEYNEQHNVETVIQNIIKSRGIKNKEEEKMLNDFFRIN